MSYSLILWKGPVTEDPDEAERLLSPYYDREEVSAFAPSDDVASVGAELLRRFPDTPDGPWGEYVPEPAQRVLMLDLKSSAGDDVIDAIVELAFKHQLVMYDPQGPDVGIPPDPSIDAPTPRPRVLDYLKIAAMGAASAGVFWVGWRVDVPVLDWVLMIVGGFFLSVVIFLAWILLFGPREDERPRRKAAR